MNCVDFSHDPLFLGQQVVELAADAVEAFFAQRQALAHAQVVPGHVLGHRLHQIGGLRARRLAGRFFDKGDVRRQGRRPGGPPGGGVAAPRPAEGAFQLPQPPLFLRILQAEIVQLPVSIGAVVILVQLQILFHRHKNGSFPFINSYYKQ